MKNVIITGGCGFIGSHVVERLLEGDYHISVLDLWESSEIRELKI